VAGGGAKSKLPAASSGAPGLPAVAKYSPDATAGQAARSAPRAPGHLAALEGALTIYVLSHLSLPGVFYEHPVSYHVSVGKRPPHKVGVPGLLLDKAWASRDALLQTEEGRRAVQAYRFGALKSLPAGDVKAAGLDVGSLAGVSGKLRLPEILMNLSAHLKTKLSAPGLDLAVNTKATARDYPPPPHLVVRLFKVQCPGMEGHFDKLVEERKQGSALLKSVRSELKKVAKAKDPVGEVPLSTVARPTLTNIVIRLLSGEEWEEMVEGFYAYERVLAECAVAELREEVAKDPLDSREFDYTENWVELVQARLGRPPPKWLSGKAKVRSYLSNLCSGAAVLSPRTTWSMFWLKD
jgi:hypothetical protein